MCCLGFWVEPTLKTQPDKKMNISDVFDVRIEEPPVKTIGELKGDETAVSVTGMITHLFKPKSDKVAYSGILYDDTGKVRFTIWKSSDIPKLVVGGTYRFCDFAAGIWNYKPTLTATRNSTIEKTRLNIKQPVPTTKQVFVTRVKKVEILDDSRILVRLIADDGVDSYTIDIVNEEILGQTAKSLMELVIQTNSPAASQNKFVELLEGKYVEVPVSVGDTYIKYEADNLRCDP